MFKAKANVELEKQGIKIKNLPKKKEVIESWDVADKEATPKIKIYEYSEPIFQIKTKDSPIYYYSKAYYRDSLLEKFIRVVLDNEETILLNPKFIEEIRIGALYIIEVPDKVEDIEIGKKLDKYFFGVDSLLEYK